MLGSYTGLGYFYKIGFQIQAYGYNGSSLGFEIIFDRPHCTFRSFQEEPPGDSFTDLLDRA